MRSIGRLLSGVIVLSCMGAARAPLHAQLVPTSDEFLVNSNTIGAQYDGIVDADATGNYVVVWSGSGEPTGGQGIVARRFTSAGVALGTEFLVNTYTPRTQFDADVAVAPDGRFVVVWTSYAQDLDDDGIFAQRFDATGIPAGTEFQVNTYTTSYQRAPTVELDAAGNFIVAWEGTFDGSYSGIAARRYDSNGVPQGGEFLVNTSTVNDQLDPAIGRIGDDFVIVWDSFVGDLSAGAVFGQRLAADGTPLGTEFRINTFTPGVQEDPDVAGGPDGDFIAVWSSANQDGSFDGIIAQRFAAGGSRIGTEFVVNSHTIGIQERPSVARAPSGNFVVAWEGPDTDVFDEVWARAFSGDGTPDGADLLLNQYTTSFQNDPSIAVTGARDFVVVWSNRNFSAAISEVQGRRLTQAGTRISGQKLFIRTPPSDPDGNRITFVSTDGSLTPPQTVFDDPRCPPVGTGSTASGARLRVIGAGGSFTIDMPCVNWLANSTGTRFRYRDASGTSCRSVVLRQGRVLKVSCKGPQVAYTLGAAQGNISVVLSTGDPATNHKYCATFGPQTGTTVHRDGSDGRSYSAIAAGPGTCP